MAIDWTRGYSSTWALYEVDVGTWADGPQVTGDGVFGVVSASIERDNTGDAPELESASVELTEEVGTDFRERHLRLVMYVRQDGEVERTDVATLLFVSTNGNTERGMHSRTLNGRSVLHPAATTKTWFAYGPYVPAGSDGAAEVGKMLSASILAPVTVDGSFELADAYVFDKSESVLVSAWSVLNAGGFRIRVDGRGRVTITQKPTEDDIALRMEDEMIRLLIPGISDDLELGEVPNVYVAEEGTLTAIATNDDAESPVSTTFRGYSVQEYDNNVVRIGGESLDAYASRKLSELSVVADAREWEREWFPDVAVGDAIRANIPSEGLVGTYQIRRQSLNCGAGIVVTEHAEREVRLWPVS